MSKLFPLQIPRIITTPAAHVASWFANALTRRVVACLLLFGVSAGLILPNLGYPRAIVFDETYFVPTAQRYLNGVFFQEPHPPLGKLLIAVGQRWLHPEIQADEFIGVEKIDRAWSPDADMTGYRLMPALFGILNPIVVFLILVLLFQRELYTFAITSFVALDNALIVQSRAALMDSFLIFFALCSILLFVLLSRKKEMKIGAFGGLAAVWGIVAACAGNVKLTGLFVLVLFFIYVGRLIWARRFQRVFILTLIFASTFVATYLGLWQVHFAVASQLGKNDYGISAEHRQILEGTNNPSPLSRFVIEMRDALEYQHRYEAGVPKLDLAKPDEIGSPWYFWPLGARAMNYRWETPDGIRYRYVYLFGNPITWLVSLLGVIGGTALVTSDLLFRFLRAGQRPRLYAFVLLYWAYMIPMMFISRVMYLYHYLPPLIIGVVLFGIVLWMAQSLSTNLKRDMLVVSMMLLVFMFWVYKPLTYYEPLTREQFQQRNIFPAWDLRCVGC